MTGQALVIDDEYTDHSSSYKGIEISSVAP
jgi:hypothetical protein